MANLDTTPNIRKITLIVRICKCIICQRHGDSVKHGPPQSVERFLNIYDEYVGVTQFIFVS